MVKELELKEPSEPEFESGCQPSEPSVGIRKGVQCPAKITPVHWKSPFYTWVCPDLCNDVVVIVVSGIQLKIA